MKKIVFFILFFNLCLQAQDKFVLKNENKVVVPFDFVNNLIILKVNINRIPLNLIFDTGIEQTILINLKPSDSLNLKEIENRNFTGIGNNNPVIKGLSSSHNKINIHNKILNNDAKIYVIQDFEFHFSELIGININGFIGGELIKDFIVKIDYKRRKIIFYNRHNFSEKKLKSYREYPVQIINNKPYVKANIRLHKNDSGKLYKFLIDTGNSDALWIFSKDSLPLASGQKTVSDYFGLGFSGEIKGIRFKSYRFYLDKKFWFKNVHIALPDFIYFRQIVETNPFDGLIGNEILRRFFVVFDYKKKKIYLKKYRHNYREKFLFNNTGLYLAYDGKVPVKLKHLITRYEMKDTGKKLMISTENSYIYKYKFVDRIVIYHIRPGSPADRAGLIKGDILLKINDKDVYQYRLDRLEKEFFYHNKKHLDLLIQRNGLRLHYKVFNIKQL
jgi:predicted aspartyl protease